MSNTLILATADKVRVEVDGGAVIIGFTPAEAKRFARLLHAAADNSERMAASFDAPDEAKP